MRWLELVRDLVNGYISWASRWYPVMEKEKAEKQAAKDAAMGKTIEVEAVDVTPGKDG